MPTNFCGDTDTQKVACSHENDSVLFAHSCTAWQLEMNRYAATDWRLLDAQHYLMVRKPAAALGLSNGECR